MILYFADRHMNILGQASTELPGGIYIEDDSKTEELEVGVAVLGFDLCFNDETRAKAEEWANTGNYILRKCGDEQEFYTIIESENNTSKGRINIYAEDAGMDLLNETVGSYTADQAHPAQYYIEKFAYDSGFEIGLNEISDRSRKLSWEGETTASARLMSVVTQFDAELSYSFDIDGLRVKHKYINLYRKRGTDNGVKLRINQEINNIIIKKSVADLATSLEVTGGTPEGSENPITLNGYKYDDGDIYISGSRVNSRSALSKWSRYLSETGDNVGHIVQFYSYDTTSQSELCNRAVSKLKKICDVSVTYEVDLSYLPDGIKIGDTVDIVDGAGDLYLSARIIKLEVSESNKRYTATIGDYQIKSSGISEKMTELAAQFEKISKNRLMYTWVAYADDANGTGISIDPAGKEYLGVASNMISRDADISDAEAYTWVKIKGETGEDGLSPTVTLKKNGKVTTITVTDKEGEKKQNIVDGQDGKNGENAILVSETAPDNPTDGQLWQTASGEPIKRWNGEKWVLHYISIENLYVEVLSAIAANLGTVTAGKIKNEKETVELDIEKGRLYTTDGVRISLLENGLMEVMGILTNAQAYKLSLGYGGIAAYGGGGVLNPDPDDDVQQELTWNDTPFVGIYPDHEMYDWHVVGSGDYYLLRTLNELKSLYKHQLTSGEVYRCGNLCWFHNYTITKLAGYSGTWQMMPEGYRPVATVGDTNALVTNQTFYGHAYLRIGTDGKMQYWCTAPNAQVEVDFDVLYFTNDAFPPDKEIIN